AGLRLEEHSPLATGGADASRMEGCRRSRCAGSDGHDGRRSRHASPGREGRSARVQLSVGQRGRLSNHLFKDERSEGASHEAPDGAARRALRPWRSSRRRRHDESGKADPGRRPRQAAGRRDVGGAGEDESRRDPRGRCRIRTIPDGGMVFPRFLTDEVKKQTSRDLTRFDLDFDIPDRFLPEFPAPIYLTTRPDLGDVSRGRLVTTDNYYELFNGILNPKQLEGLRLLVTPFAQQQFNLTADRRSERPSLGVACFDCHQNGSSNGATHQVGDIRPQEFRHRIDTPTLRGVNVQRIFGSQRGLKTVEDFTEFEQRAAYFDGDPVIATKKGVNILERGSQVHDMAEFQE